MCINPSLIWVQRGPKWEQQAVGCRQCWRCKRNRVEDYVGRCLAESSASAVTCTVSLTYAPRDDYADKLLTPRHFQLFMKLLRRAGHKVRYLVAGEYGELKGRAHFHAILFFEHLDGPEVPAFYNPGHIANPDTSVPFSRAIPQKRICHIREWPHGHILADWNADERSIRYVCKYILSDDKNRAWFSLSKKPALGAAWFAQKAERAKSFSVLPSGFEYTPPGGSRDRSYMMSGATRRDYLNAITMDPADRDRMSEWVQKTFDKHHRARVIDELEKQPLAVLEELFAARCSDEEQARQDRRLWQWLRETDELQALLDNSGERMLVRDERGQWSPPSEERKDNGNVSSSS